jgi:hypothetical protein
MRAFGRGRGRGERNSVLIMVKGSRPAGPAVISSVTADPVQMGTRHHAAECQAGVLLELAPTSDTETTITSYCDWSVVARDPGAHAMAGRPGQPARAPSSTWRHCSPTIHSGLFPVRTVRRTPSRAPRCRPSARPAGGAGPRGPTHPTRIPGARERARTPRAGHGWTHRCHRLAVRPPRPRRPAEEQTESPGRLDMITTREATPVAWPLRYRPVAL